MPAFGTDPFQNFLDYQPPRPNSVVAVNSQAALSPFGANILSVSVNSAKFLGLVALSPSDTAATASKVLGLAALSPSDSAAVTAKLLGYVVLQSDPIRRTWDDLPPRGPRYPVDLRTWTNPGLTTVGAVSFIRPVLFINT